MTQESPCILLLDSGSGGLSLLKELRARNPLLSYAYCFDHEFFPYGSLAVEVLEERVVSLVRKLIRYCHPRLLVLGCNTASTLCLPVLRQEFDFPIVGVVPAIKPAAEQSQTGVISLLATPVTVESPYTDDLIQRFAPNLQVVKKASLELVHLAEEKLRGVDVLERCAVELTDLLSVPDLDTVVLGCTHFIHLRAELTKIFAQKVRLIDPCKAVASRVEAMLGETEQVHFRENSSSVLGFSTEAQVSSVLWGSSGLTEWGIERLQYVEM